MADIPTIKITKGDFTLLEMTLEHFVLNNFMLSGNCPALPVKVIVMQFPDRYLEITINEYIEDMDI